MGITVSVFSFDQRSISRRAFVLGILEGEHDFLPPLCVGLLFPAILLTLRTLLIYSYPLTLSQGYAQVTRRVQFVCVSVYVDARTVVCVDVGWY